MSWDYRRPSQFSRFCVIFFVAAVCAHSAWASGFRFYRDTFAFNNMPLLEYQDGRPTSKRASSGEDGSSYTRRCFVMSRAAMQFHKFARFDPDAPPLDDRELTRRVRAVTRLRPWLASRSPEQRIVFPGYKDLRAMSEARASVLKKNLGLGWPTYLRPGNGRMFYRHDEKYQENTRANLEAALAQGEMFVIYLSSYPYFTINHSVLIYARRPVRPGAKIERYLVYDPNHPDAPRELKWSPRQRVFNYQKDEEFVGGFTRVYQVYGRAWQ